MAIGKVGNQEGDFIAAKADKKKYIRVTENMIALDCDLTQTQNGIRIIKVIDFLML